MQLLQIQARFVAQFNMLQAFPQPFDRLQIGSVPRKRFHDKRLLAHLNYEIPDRTAPVNGRAIPDDQQRLAHLPLQVSQECDAMQPIQRLPTDQCIDSSSSRYGPHYRKVVSASPTRQYWRVALRAIGANHCRQQVEARFIRKNKGSALLPGTTTQLRPRFRSPLLDLLFIALNSPSNRYLWCPAHRLKHAGHMILVKRDAEFPAKNFGNTGTGPYIPSKAEGLGSMPQKVGQQALLLGRQLDMATVWVCQQTVCSCLASACQPLAHSCFGNSQSLSNISVDPAQPIKLNCSKPSPLPPVVIPCRPHSQDCIAQQLKLAAQLSIGVHRDTVARVIRTAEEISKQAGAPPTQIGHPRTRRRSAKIGHPSRRRSRLKIGHPAPRRLSGQ
jgi:hypothetical protein